MVTLQNLVICFCLSNFSLKFRGVFKHPKHPLVTALYDTMQCQKCYRSPKAEVRDETPGELGLWSAEWNYKARTKDTRENIQYLAPGLYPKGFFRISDMPIYTLCLKKNTADIFRCNSSRHCWILIIFGTCV